MGFGQCRQLANFSSVLGNLFLNCIEQLKEKEIEDRSSKSRGVGRAKLHFSVTCHGRMRPDSFDGHFGPHTLATCNNPAFHPPPQKKPSTFQLSQDPSPNAQAHLFLLGRPAGNERLARSLSDQISFESPWGRGRLSFRVMDVPQRCFLVPGLRGPDLNFCNKLHAEKRRDVGERAPSSECIVPLFPCARCIRGSASSTD